MKYRYPYSKRASGVFFYPPLPSWAQRPAREKLFSLMGLENKATTKRDNALYISIPFCDSICSFCCFFKYLKREGMVEKYLGALEREMAIYGKTPYIRSIRFGAVYFGGGTPTCLSTKQLLDLLSNVRKHFNLSKDVEITIEASPSNFDEQKMKIALKNGANRVSFGIQTFHDKLGRMLELPQDSNKAIDAIATAHRVGYKNVDIDLIYNLPGRSMEEWEEDLERAISLNLEHITVFRLHVVPHTKLAERLQRGEIPPIGNLDKEIEMYEKAIQILSNAGYIQWTVITNFVKSGVTCKYAKIRTQLRDVLGLGCGASGHINDYVYRNIDALEKYIQTINDEWIPIDRGIKEESRKEKMHGMMAKGLMLLDGIRREEFRKRFGRQPEDFFYGTISKLKKRGLIVVDEKGIRVSYKGRIWGGNVCREFASERYRNAFAY